MDKRGRHGNHATGSANGRWNSKGRLVSSHGYIVVRVPADFPHAWGRENRQGQRYAYEHHVVAVNKLGRPLKRGEVVHHRNGNRQDNRWENFTITTKSGHQRHHARNTRKRDRLGRFL